MKGHETETITVEELEVVYDSSTEIKICYENLSEVEVVKEQSPQVKRRKCQNKRKISTDRSPEVEILEENLQPMNRKRNKSEDEIDISTNRSSEVEFMEEKSWGVKRKRIMYQNEEREMISNLPFMFIQNGELPTSSCNTHGQCIECPLNGDGQEAKVLVKTKVVLNIL